MERAAFGLLFFISFLNNFWFYHTNFTEIKPLIIILGVNLY